MRIDYSAIKQELVKMLPAEVWLQSCVQLSNDRPNGINIIISIPFEMLEKKREGNKN